MKELEASSVKLAELNLAASVVALELSLAICQVNMPSFGHPDHPLLQTVFKCPNSALICWTQVWCFILFYIIYVLIIGHFRIEMNIWFLHGISRCVAS